MKTATAPSYPVSIFIAGDLAQARFICREFCQTQGECVTVTPTEFIYTGGAETGVVVGFINYPRFPREPAAILERARLLAERLIEGLCQHSASIETPTETLWVSRRPE